MKRTMIFAVSLALVVTGGMSVAGADMLSNTMFSAQEKAYLSQLDKGRDFTPAATETEKPEKAYANTMLTEDEQEYLQAVSNGSDFEPTRTAGEKEKPALTNTMFSQSTLRELEDINIDIL